MAAAETCMTLLGGTLTTEGFIPHKAHPRLGFAMPIKLALPPEGAAKQKLPQPFKRGISYVFALPGGKEFLVVE